MLTTCKTCMEYKNSTYLITDIFTCVLPPIPRLFHFSSVPAAPFQEAQADFSPPVENKRREAGEQTEEPSDEATEHCQKTAQRAKEAETGNEGYRFECAPPPGDVQEETR